MSDCDALIAETIRALYLKISERFDEREPHSNAWSAPIEVVAEVCDKFNPATVLESLARREQQLRLEARAEAYERCARNVGGHPHFAGAFMQWAAEVRAELAKVKGVEGRA